MKSSFHFSLPQQRWWPQGRLPRRKACAVAIVLALQSGWVYAGGAAPSPARGAPADIEYDSSFLVGGAADNVDLSRFEQGNSVLPGVYSVDISVYDSWQGRQDLTFVAVDGKNSAEPCFDRQLLTEMGLDWNALAGSAKVDKATLARLDHEPLCGNLSSLIPGGSYQYDASQQTLDVDIPQIYLSRKARGWVDPSQWDSGITAGTLNYDINGYESSQSGHRYAAAFAGLNAGLNLGGWRLRHSGSSQWSNRTSATYHTLYNRVQHDITPLQAQLTLGDTTTDGTLFDGSVSIRGIQIASDDRMLPQSLRGFAPVIRGVANTNALVIVRQNGQVILQTSVPAGPFKIDDLYPTGQSGELRVTVREADGQEHEFTVPFASLPQLLRPGQTRFSVSAGRVRHVGNHGDTPPVAQASWQRGLTNWATTYDGFTSSTGYVAATAGMAFNLPIGALGVDLTQARTTIPGSGTRTGRSLHIGYSSVLDAMGTTFTVAAYRYSSRDYLSLERALWLRDAARYGQASRVQSELGHLDLNLSQPVGEGILYASGSSVRYWGGGGSTTYSAGYSNSFHGATYDLRLERTRDRDYGLPSLPGSASSPFNERHTDTQLMLSVSIPLGSSAHAVNLGSNVTIDSRDGSGQQVTLSGSAGSENQWNYGLSANRVSYSNDKSYSVNGQYQTRVASLGANASHSSDGGSQSGIRASGGLVIHQGGVTFANNLGETIALVHAADADGAAISGMPSSRIDGNGYGIAPYMTPYVRNRVSVDPDGIPLDVELMGGSQEIAPRAGAVVEVNFETSVGRTALIDTTLPGGKPLPFGAEVTDEKGQSLGLVGQGSRIVARGLQDHGTLKVSWGDDADESCALAYDLPPRDKRKKAKADDGYQHVSTMCEPHHASPDPKAAAVRVPVRRQAQAAASVTGMPVPEANAAKLVTSCGIDAAYGRSWNGSTGYASCGFGKQTAMPIKALSTTIMGLYGNPRNFDFPESFSTTCGVDAGQYCGRIKTWLEGLSISQQLLSTTTISQSKGARV
jgi:outer membrane usher protein